MNKSGKIILSLASLLFTLLFLELGSRWYQKLAIRDFPAAPERAEDFKNFEDFLDWAYLLGQIRDYGVGSEGIYYPFTVTGLKPNYSFKLKNMDISINSSGFRDEEFSIPKKKDTFRIFILGGSTVEGIYNERWTLDYYLQKELDSMFPNLEVINAGVGGYYSQNELALLQTRILDLEPDFILIYNGFNDLQYGARPDYEKGKAPNYKAHENLLEALANRPTVSSVLAYNANFLAHQSAFIKIVFRSLFNSKVPYTYFPDIKINEQAINDYVNNVKIMKAVLEAAKIPGLITFQPVLPYCKEKTTEYEKSVLNYLINEEKTNWIEESNMVWPRVGKIIRDLPDSNLVKTRDISCVLEDYAETAYIDSIHATPGGYEVTAKGIADIIKRDFAWLE